MDSIRILIAEKHPVIRRGLVELLSMIEGLEVAGDAANGGDAVAQSYETRPDVMLIDLHLPGIPGSEVIRSVQQGSPETSIIVLSTYDHDEDINRALEAGAQACLLAGAGTEELVTTIRRVHAGNQELVSI